MMATLVMMLLWSVENFVERSEKQLNISETSGVAHTPYAPDLARYWSETPADFDPVAAQEQGTHVGFGRTAGQAILGNPHRCELG